MRSVLGYLNDLADTRYGDGPDAQYLRERLLQGRTFDECCQVVEAAIASGRLEDMHPRRVFSERWFGDLLALRRDRTRWAKCAERFDAVCRDMLRRVPPAADEIAEVEP